MKHPEITTTKLSISPQAKRPSTVGGIAPGRTFLATVCRFSCASLTMMVLVTCMVCGCSTFDLSKKIPWMDTDQVSQPTKMTTLWTHTVLNTSGQKSVRGFGGRIMFHGKENEKPIRVEGTLIVYAFDETNKPSSTPERKYVFTPEQFEKHYSRSKIGHSYSIWVPWDEVGGPPRKISLLAKFEPVGGAAVMSDNAQQMLPGIAPLPYDDPADEANPEAAEIQQAGYQQPAKSRSKGRSTNERITDGSDTIDLPPSFIRRMNPPDPNPVINWQKSTLDANSPDPAASGTPGAIDAQKSTGNLEHKAGKPSAETDSQDQSASVTPQKALADRQQELLDHFGRRKSRVQKVLVARSKPVPLPTRLPPANELSLLPPSSGSASMDRVGSGTASGSVSSR